MVLLENKSVVFIHDRFGPKVSLGTLRLPQESMVGRLRRQRYISRKTVPKALKVIARGLALAGGSTQVCSVSIVCARSPAPIPARTMICCMATVAALMPAQAGQKGRSLA